MDRAVEKHPRRTRPRPRVSRRTDQCHRTRYPESRTTTCCFSQRTRTPAGATSAIDTLNSAISTVASLRASFGTVQNRLESTIRSLAVAILNTAAAESQIRNVDFASETAELTRNQVLQQTGVSVLGQANVSTHSALQLLG
ncbi:MAG TPA: hypothetical protein EYG46_10955 [Myxococcales bacterium]|nr:hypothetical protein [Myxococcales bacterium]HIM01499.1 hypothetical protein [Myxococcales bacterium]